MREHDSPGLKKMREPDNPLALEKMREPDNPLALKKVREPDNPGLKKGEGT